MLVGFALLSLHLLREQIVAASSIKDAVVVTGAGDVIQDPRKIPEELRVQRGNIYAGNTVIASSEVISPSRMVHRTYPEPDISYLAGYYNPTIYGTTGIEDAFNQYLSGQQALDPIIQQQRTSSTVPWSAMTFISLSTRSCRNSPRARSVSAKAR